MTCVPTILDAGQRMRLFRRCLEALAEPGRITTLEADAEDGLPVAAGPLFALADLMSPVASLRDDAAAADAIAEVAALTHAPLVEPRNARLVLALAPLTPEALAPLNRGTREVPELASLVFAAVDSVGTGDLTLRLTGPGIDGSTDVAVGGIDREAIGARDELIDYPLGIDLLLIDAAGNVLGLPRTTRIEVLA